MEFYNVFYTSIGPLLYHFADMPNEKSVELSYETIKRAMLTHYGFQLIVSLASFWLALNESFGFRKR